MREKRRLPLPALVTAALVSALPLTSCDEFEDRIGELAGDWTGFCSFQTGGTGVLELTIEPDGDAFGYESVYATSFLGRATYHGDQFYLYAAPIELQGGLINGDLIGTIYYTGTAGDDEGSFDLRPDDD